MTPREEKIEEILKGLGFTFFDDGVLRDTYISKTELFELLDSVWNLAIDTAADNAEVDYEDHGTTESGGTVEVYVLKESILKLKV